VIIRPYEKDRDLDAARRVWGECGWIERGSADHAEAIDLALDSGRTLVAEMDGAAEALVVNHSGDMQYLDTRLPMASVSGVTTSLVARKQGIAGRLTAKSIARDAADGAAVAVLGMFDQGFYDRLGFGSGAYDILFAFDPQTLRVPSITRPPKRLSKADWAAVHASRVGRARRHGSCSLHPAEFTRAEINWTTNGFGLGYFDGEGGALSHHVWFEPKGSIESGPYQVKWMPYQNDAQLLELLSVMRAIGDQVRSIKMFEPSHVQLQDFTPTPFRRFAHAGDGSKYIHKPLTMTGWQARICDIEACVQAARGLPGRVQFNLTLRDPFDRYLAECDSEWAGCSGEYIVTFGEDSQAHRGRDDSLPTLDASLGAFTRMWLGVRPASGLAVSDDLHGPAELLDRLDRVLRLPKPDRDWEF